MWFEMSRVGPFMRHTSLHQGEIVTDEAIRLMARGGVPAVTLRSFTDDFGIPPQAVRQWFGGSDQMWNQIVQRFGWRWVASLTDMWRDDPLRERPGRASGQSIDDEARAECLAAVRGLRHTVCATHEPMALARAHAVLDTLVDLLVAPTHERPSAKFI